MFFSPYFCASFLLFEFVSCYFLLYQNNSGSAGEFFLVTNPESYGSPPKRAPPPLPDYTPPAILAPPPVITPSIPDLDTSPVASSISQSESFNSTQVRELTVDDIEDFEDDDLDEADSLRISRRTRNNATDLALGLPSFKTGKSLNLVDVCVCFPVLLLCSVAWVPFLVG